MAGGAVGTVRGRYELDAPALRTLRDLEKQGIRTQAQMRAVGEALDEIGGVKQAQELRDFNQAQADVRRGAERMGRTMRDEWVSTTRVVRLEVRRQLTEIAKLEAALDRIGGRNATARVSVRGASAGQTAKVMALGSALDRVDRGQIGTTVARTTPRPPRTGGLGGGGGSIRSTRSQPGLLDFGRKGIQPRNLLMGGALAYARPLLGAGTALAGSGAYALGGAGALGLTGGLGLAAGVGGSLLTGKMALGGITAAQKAMEKYTDAVADYGRASNQARMAKMNLDQAMASAPKGTRQLLRDVKDLRSEFEKMTRPGTNAMMQLFVGGVQSGRRLLRNGGASAINRVSKATSTQGQKFTDFLAGSTGQRAVGLGSRIYSENLGYARQTGQYGIEAAVNVVQAARPMFEEMMRGIRDWTRGWSTSTRDIGAVRRVIKDMTDNLKSWWDLTRQAGGLVGALFGTSQGNGKKMVDDLTGQLQQWTDWLKMNPSKVRDFFTSSTASAEKLAGAIGHIASSLWQIMGVVTPLLDRFAQLAGLAGSLGLGTPGVGAAAFGAYRALSGGTGKGGGGSTGGGAAGGGFIPIMTGGLGVRGAASAARGTASGTYSLARSFGYGRAASASAATGALAMDAGSAATRIGGLALRGAGKAAWPIALTMGVLDYASFNGSPAQRVQAAASGATLGLIPRPVSDAAHADKGVQSARRFLGGLSTKSTRADQAAAIASIQGRMANNTTLLTKGRWASNTYVGSEGGGATYQVPGGPSGQYQRVFGGEKKELTSQNKELAAALKERIAIFRKYRADRDRTLNASSRAHADQAASDYASGFKRRSRRVGATNAMGQIVTEVLGQTGASSGRRPAGKRELAQQTLDWAHAQAQANPALWAQYDRLVKGIEHRFDALKGHVQVVNGQILDGSSKQWNDLADNISAAARRGVSQTGKEWDRLKAMALAELTAMGYTKSEASAIFKSPRLRSQAATKTGSGQPLLQSESNKAKAHGLGGIGDGPGRSIGGGSRRKIGDGGGNASAGNRSGSIGTSAGQGGALMGADPSLGGYASIGRSMGLSVTSGRRPGAITSAGNVSYHSSGNAIDMSGSPSAMRRFALYMAQHYGSQLEELIYSPLGWSIKNGQRTAPYAVAEHYNHVHVADTNPAGGAGGAAGGIGGGAGANPVSARASGLGGVTGALADAAGAAMASGINQRLVGAGTGGGMIGGLGGGAVGSLGSGGAYTLSQLANLWTSAGGNPGVATLMAHVAMAESGGRPGARNPSGATGLWQILGNPFAGNAADPYTNARMAVAKYNSQGLGAWAASRGGWGKFAGGAQGDGPGRSGTPGRRISSKPRRQISSMRRNATAGRGAINVHFHGDMHVRSEADIHAIAELVGGKILEALGGTTK